MYTEYDTQPIEYSNGTVVPFSDTLSTFIYYIAYIHIFAHVKADKKYRSRPEIGLLFSQKGIPSDSTEISSKFEIETMDPNGSIRVGKTVTSTYFLDGVHF